MTALLQVRGVSKTYGQIRALTDIDLEVPAGGIFGIVGPNGAGKTTLFSILCGFLGADKGEVIVAGNVVRPNHPPPGGMLTILPQDARFLPSVPRDFLAPLAPVRHLFGRRLFPDPANPVPNFAGVAV